MHEEEVVKYYYFRFKMLNGRIEAARLFDRGFHGRAHALQRGVSYEKTALWFDSREEEKAAAATLPSALKYWEFRLLMEEAAVIGWKALLNEQEQTTKGWRFALVQTPNPVRLQLRLLSPDDIVSRQAVRGQYSLEGRPHLLPTLAELLERERFAARCPKMPYSTLLQRAFTVAWLRRLESRHFPLHSTIAA